MDKQTLSNYGWVVVLVLILAVLLALATPFGSFVSTAVKNVTGGFWDVNSASLNAVGLDTGDIGFDGDPASCGIEGHYIGDDKGEHGIPVEDCKSGHTYTCECEGWVVPDGGKYTMKSGTVYTAGQQLPCGYIAVNGDKYVDKYYRYNYYSSSGWSVSVLDKSLTSYGDILENIASKYVVNMSYAFQNCTSLTTAPEIPNSITSMEWTFKNCTSLTTAPVIPSKVTYMYSTFYGCTSLTTAPVIPNSVTDMRYTFKGCTSLTTAPVIPSKVTNMENTFYGCTSLTTAPVIPNNVTNMYMTFSGCKSLTTAPVIPSKVTNMYGTFDGCTKLTTAPVIPNSVTNMEYTFYGCTSLTGTIKINANPTSYNYCFYGVKFITQGITLTGSSTKLSALKATGSNS